MDKKKFIMLLVILMGFSACTKYEEFPLRPVSFEIEGKQYYSAKDTRIMTEGFVQTQKPDTLSITEVDGCLNISYTRDTDFINHDINSISLNLAGVNATFQTGEKISFDVSDELEEYPSVYFSPVKTSYASDSDLYRAVNGWIEFDMIDWENETVSGKFEFKAVLEDDNTECNHNKEIEVKNGSFKNIPFKVPFNPNYDKL